MNYLDIINKCLLELNYRQVSSFAELVKNDHKRIKSIINIINQEICAASNWNFLLRKTTFTIPANTTEVSKTINGRILYLLVDGKKYQYVDDIEPFLVDEAKDGTYTECADKFLFKPAQSARSAQIVYYTKNCVTDSLGGEKMEMTEATDCSVIPSPFDLQLLVYGTCLRLKANPSYIRFSYWMSMYKEALANLKFTSSINSEDAPVVRLFRQ
jgi:hypothetical protein